jgi:predicted MarR family transcription regulator
MKSRARAKPGDEHTQLAPLLGRTEHERMFLEFEQALICASQAFYRFAGTILGAPGRQHSLTGQENVILQQLLFTPVPRSVTDLSRFSNRDDISNIQYSLRKLISAGLIEKVPGSTNRDTRYQPTAAGRALAEEIVVARRDLLVNPSMRIVDIEQNLRTATDVMSLVTGLYDHASRLSSGNR